MKRMILKAIIFLWALNLFTDSITVPPPCGFFSWNVIDEIPLGKANDLPQFTVFGDSRAKFASEHGRLGNFASASKDGKPLILPNQIKKIQNLGWAGATSSDNPPPFASDLFFFVSLFNLDKAKAKTWWR